jgi:hypothetical protein
VSLFGAGRVKKDELIGIRDREAAQDNLLKNREDTGVRADAEGQREDGDCGECRVFGQHSNSEPDIAPQAAHHFSLDPQTQIQKRTVRCCNDVAGA